jgi:hypothetical protein
VRAQVQSFLVSASAKHDVYLLLYFCTSTSWFLILKQAFTAFT